MNTRTDPDQAVATRRHALGFPWPVLLGLAALGLPRVILHDLHLIAEGSAATWLLALAPVAVWIACAVILPVPRPFLTVLSIGGLFGAMLVITHQLLWVPAFRGAPPALGDGPAAELIPRLAAIPSGLLTGAMIGAIAGLIAWGISAAMRRGRS